LAGPEIGEALITSAHTSLAAARAPARSPLAALLQTPSTLALVAAESVGALVMIDLHTATASATPAALVGTVAGVDGDVEVLAAGAGVELVVPPAALLGAGVELLWLLDVELLLLPQPAINTPPASATTSHLDSCLIICPP